VDEGEEAVKNEEEKKSEPLIDTNLH
jgi:hypothetical protein